MGRTTIEVDEDVRDRLRAFKDSNGMTYDGAIDRLLAISGEPVQTESSEGDQFDRGGRTYTTPIITPAETAGMCTFHPHFRSYNYHPVTFGGDGSVNLSWSEFQSVLDGVRPYLSKEFLDGSFSIHQEGAAWYGYGLDSFITALDNQNHRYNRAGVTDPHHTETAVYLDHTDWGMLSIGLQGNSKRAEKVSVHFVTEGIPLSPYPYTTIVGQFGLDLTNAHRNRAIETETIDYNATLSRTDIVDTITQPSNRHEGPYVQGIIIENPFYDDLSRLQSATAEADSFKEITTYEHLPCYLTGFHPEAEEYDYKFKQMTLHSHCNLTQGFGFTNVCCRARTLFETGCS